MSASPLPPGRRQIVNADGAPLVGGKVYYYQPGTLVPANTWADFGQTVLNPNPITLDALGSWPIWGAGRYREIVTDALGNQLWDQETFAPNAQPYETGFYFVDAPNANNIVGVWNFTEAVTFPTNFAGSVGSVNTNPSVNTTFDIKKVSGGVATTIGAMNISTLGVVTFTSNISNPAFAVGDRLEWVVQAGGANTLAGPAATMLGALA